MVTNANVPLRGVPVVKILNVSLVAGVKPPIKATLRVPFRLAVPEILS
jgi:hypothetical protein